MAGLSDAFMSELLGRTDIVALVSEYVRLKPRGGRMWGCCPFHNEKTPSFSVSADKQLYYCFGCHKGGTAVQFLMDIEKVPFQDAVKVLAEKVGMALPDRIDEAALKRSRELKERLYEASRQAALYYHSLLKGSEGSRAREYLGRRGVSPETTASFGLGCAPEGWDNLSAFLREKGFSNDELIAAGLAVRSKKNPDNVFDMFRNRVIFPIIGGYSRVVGFGARAMGDEQPKYLNTAETPIFNKRQNLYNLSSLKGKSSPYVVLVEGYMDVVSLAQHGVTGTVATLGTALTPEQAKLIARFSSRVYVSYDGDDAGQTATIRALGILSEAGINAKVISIPDGQDPDDYVRRFGKEGYDGLIADALPQNAFRLAHLASKYDLGTADGKEAYAVAGSVLVATFPPVERERYLSELARATGYSRETLVMQGTTAAPPQPTAAEKNRVPSYRNTMNATRNNGSTKTGERVKAECMLFRLVSDDPALRDKIDTPMFSAPGAVEAFEALATGRGAAVIASLSEDGARFAAQAAAIPKPINPKGAFADAVYYIRRDEISREMADISVKVGELDGEERKGLLERHKTLMNKLVELDASAQERGEGIER